ncbi:MAG: hypothetical protein IIA54_05265 [Chloroflexi bacterium]|nr:hypothetical protein [Chloroflexota bacterium]
MKHLMKRLMLAFAVLSLIGGPVLADHCARRVRVRRLAFVQPFYQVGSALREEAIAQRAAERALEAFTQRLKTGLAETASTPNVATNTQVGAVFRKDCLRCHSGPGAERGLDLSDPAALSETPATQ